MAIRQPKVELSTKFNELATNLSMDSTNYRRRRDAEGVRPRSGPTTKSSDAEGVRPRSGPTTKWSDSKSPYVRVVISSDVDSFEIEFVRLSAFQIAIFRRTSTSKRRQNDDFEQTTSSSDAFGVGPLHRRTTSSSDAFGGHSN